MADNYLQFSEIIPQLSPEEEHWLEEQSESVLVFGDEEFPEDDPKERDLPEGEPDFSGPRFLRDNPDFDCSCDVVGFEFAFHGEHDPRDRWGRHLWLYAEESGDPTRAAWLVRKFLQRFRQDQSWSLTYATTCSKLRVSEFGGGAVFVTAEKIQCQEVDGFVEDCTKSFQRGRYTARIVQEAKKRGIEPSDLDDAVHDAASTLASATDNAGLEEQIAFLVEQLGTEETQRLLDEREAARGTDQQQNATQPHID